MSVWQALILGLVQGATEFLPVSSSGHLQIVPWLFGWDDLTSNEDLERAFSVALHVGTFVGAAAYFREDIVRLARAGVSALGKRKAETEDERLALLLALSAVPAAVIGAGLDALLEGEFVPEPVVGILLIVFGVLLWVADRRPARRREKDWNTRDALGMGLAQALALFPGVSRSGATITAGRFFGLERDAATRISFLMSLPVIGGAGVYEGIRLLRGGGLPSGFGGAFAVGMAAAGITGFAAVWGLLRFVRRRSFTPFVVYRVVVGAIVLAVAATRA
jgi:undecaprenyl-diphosphatase